MRISPRLFPLLLALGAPLAAAGQTVEVRGRVTERDATTGVSAVTVRFLGTAHQAVTDSAGRFTFRNVQPGDYTIEVKRLGYADHSERVHVPTSAALQMSIRIDAAAIGVPAITVTAISADERARRAEGTSSKRLDTDAIRAAVAEGRKLEDVIRASGFGLRVAEGDFVVDGDLPQRILCIEPNMRGAATSFRRPTGRQNYPACNMVPVFLDGLKIGHAGSFLLRVPLENFQSIEWLNVIAAGTRFGVLSENKGVLVLQTRSGRQP